VENLIGEGTQRHNKEFLPEFQIDPPIKI